MLGTTHAGLGLLASRSGNGAARLRIGAELGHRQRGLKPFPRFFTRAVPLRLHQQQAGAKDGKLPPQQEHNHPGLGVAGPVSLPRTGVGRFGAGGGVDAIITTLVGITFVFIGGVAYVRWYKADVLNKIEVAFEPGNDPVLALANHALRGGDVDKDGVRSYSWSSRHLNRKEQESINSIMKGEEAGRYFLFLGPKGSGKTTMVIDAMRAVNADGIAMCDAHPNLEVFRLRLGKALNYSYHEDSQMGLFQRRGPREGGTQLDIERAMNKLEKVAIRRSKRTGRPLVVIFNNIHLFNDDEEGRQLLQQLQQRAESWAESGVATLVFISDDFWPYPVMSQIANRMRTFSVKDIEPGQAFTALKQLRKEKYGESKLESDEALKEAVKVAGGRLAYLNRFARARDLEYSVNKLRELEKAWLLANAGLVPSFEDDAIDEQKWSRNTWLLLREFVRRRVAQEDAMNAARPERSEPSSPIEPVPMTSIPHHECREIIIRPEFLDRLDNLNIITIDTRYNVRLGSMLTLDAAREIVMKEGFDKLLKDVSDRIDEIERLSRTREITFQNAEDGERIRAIVDKIDRRISK